MTRYQQMIAHARTHDSLYPERGRAYLIRVLARDFRLSTFAERVEVVAALEEIKASKASKILNQKGAVSCATH